MRAGRRRRALVVAFLVAAALGFVAGWSARLWYRRSHDQRARDAVEGIRDRARALTR